MSTSKMDIGTRRQANTFYVASTDARIIDIVDEYGFSWAGNEMAVFRRSKKEMNKVQREIESKILAYCGCLNGICEKPQIEG